MTSPIPISNITQEWVEVLEKWHLDLFLIPTIVITLATLLASPVLLVSIFLSRALRQETRYLLLANILVADLFLVLLNLATLICNALRAPMQWLGCELVTTLTVTSYCCAIYTVTLMVVDTYAAVRWPLRYRDVIPPSLTYCILVGVWVLAAIYPFTVMIKTQVASGNFHEKLPVSALMCSLLISYCYIRLYMITRTQGIWHNRFSRARVTLLAHGVLLLLYFAPGFLFTIELVLIDRKDIPRDVRVWVSTVNMCVFMLLPRVFAPYLYGIRYREISDTVMLLLLHQHRRLKDAELPCFHIVTHDPRPRFYD
uniref:G-protein coupled receptors family 1 profile domain-containing protein n=1 Tax=Pundamilia nyererei TaxID=303518 RepID=A0A3B4FQB3_9CICH